MSALQIAKESIVKVYEHVFDFGPRTKHTVKKSKIFNGTVHCNGSAKVSWHYVIHVNEYSVTVALVIDSCSETFDALMELNSTFFKREINPIKGKTKTGSTLGTFEISMEDIRIDYVGPRVVKLRLHLFSSEDCKIRSDGVPVTTVCVKPVKSRLQEAFTNLVSNELLADVTFFVGQQKQKFYAQRAILSVRSPVFAAMFQSGMLESTQNRVTIEDIKPDAFQEVLRFIYTDEVQGLEKIAPDLLAAADKYALDCLKQVCENYLRVGITKETALETLALADLYHAQGLKDQAIQYICANIKSLQTTDWNGFCSANPHLAAKIISKMTMN